MKLNKKNWNHIPIGNVVECIEKHDKKPLQNGLSSFVGLEHIDGDSLKIIGSGSIEDGTTFTKIFQAGDVLFGKRRAYLRKVAVADFSGICSGDILVLRAKESLNSKLLPYYASSDSFISYAISTSAGSLSPRTKWRDLSNFEISFPPFDEQQRIVELFQSVEQGIVYAEEQEENLKSLRKALINKITRDNPVFGNLIDPKKCKKVSIGDISVEISDRTDNPSESGFDKFVGLENFESGEVNISSWSSTDGLVSAMKLFKAEDVLFARRNTYLKRTSKVDFDGVCSGDAIVIRVMPDMIFPMFLTLIMNTDEFWDFAISNAAGTMSKRVKWRDLETYSFVLPDIKTQETIVNVFSQIETCIAQIRQQKETLKKLKQKLLNEILG